MRVKKKKMKKGRKERQKPSVRFPRSFQEGRHIKFKSMRLSETKNTFNFTYFGEVPQSQYNPKKAKG